MVLKAAALLRGRVRVRLVVKSVYALQLSYAHLELLKLLKCKVMHSPAVNMYDHGNEHGLELIGRHEAEHSVLASFVVNHVSKCRLASYVDVVALKIAIIIECAYYSNIHEMRQKRVLLSQDESCLFCC